MTDSRGDLTSGVEMASQSESAGRRERIRLPVTQENRLAMTRDVREDGRKTGENARHGEVDLSESSIYGKDAQEQEVGSVEDVATDAAIDRLEAVTGGADDPAIYGGRLGRQIEALDASTAEELDALEVNLRQEDERPNSRDGSGRIVDDVAEEQIAEFTEVGPDLDEEGAFPVAPGRDDTSAVLRRHHPNTDVTRADAVVEGNVEDVRSEELGERHVDEGTAG
jgi:hypothetical protein